MTSDKKHSQTFFADVQARGKSDQKVPQTRKSIELPANIRCKYDVGDHVKITIEPAK